MESLSFRQAVSWKTTLIFFMNDRNKSVFFSLLAFTLKHSTKIFFSMQKKSRMQRERERAEEKKGKEKLMTSYVMRIDFPSLTSFESISTCCLVHLSSSTNRTVKKMCVYCFYGVLVDIEKRNRILGALIILLLAPVGIILEWWWFVIEIFEHF